MSSVCNNVRSPENCFAISRGNLREILSDRKEIATIQLRVLKYRNQNGLKIYLVYPQKWRKNVYQNLMGFLQIKIREICEIVICEFGHILLIKC